MPFVCGEWPSLPLLVIIIWTYLLYESEKIVVHSTEFKAIKMSKGRLRARDCSVDGLWSMHERMITLKYNCDND